MFGHFVKWCGCIWLAADLLANFCSNALGFGLESPPHLRLDLVRHVKACLYIVEDIGKQIHGLRFESLGSLEMNAQPPLFDGEVGIEIPYYVGDSVCCLTRKRWVRP